MEFLVNGGEGYANVCFRVNKNMRENSVDFQNGQKYISRALNDRLTLPLSNVLLMHLRSIVKESL